MVQPVIEQPKVVKPIEFTDLKAFIQEGIKNVNESYTDIYKNYFLDTSDRKIKLKKDDETRRTNIKTPMTLMFIDKAANSLMKMGGRFVITDLFSDVRGEDSEQIINEMLELVDRVMRLEKNKNTMKDIIKDAITVGTGTLKVGYLSKSYESDYIDFNGKQQKVIRYDDTPILEYVSPYQFFPYYNTSELDEAVFISERKLATREYITKMLSSSGVTGINRDDIDKEYNYIDERDYNAIKSNMPFYGYGMKEDTDLTIDDVYKINKLKKIYEIIELHTKTHTWYFINGKEFGPYQTKEQRVLFGYRYRMIRFRKISGSIRAMGLGHFLKPLQHEFDAITNSRIDNVLMAVNKMMVVSQDTNLAGNANRFKMGPGKVIKTTDPRSIQPFDVGEVPGSSYKETDNLFGLAQATTGVTSMALGLQNKVERVAGSSELLTSAIDDSLIEIVDSIATLRGQLLKDILVLTLAYMQREQLDKFLGKDNKLKNIDIQTIINDYEFSFEPDTEVTKANAVMVQLLINYLNTTAGLRDANGAPIEDYKQIAKRIRKATGLPLETEPSATDALTQIGQPQPTDEATLTALQSLGGAGALGSLATNSSGVNTDGGQPQVQF